MKKLLIAPLLLISFLSAAQAPYVIDSVFRPGDSASLPQYLCSANGKVFFSGRVNNTRKQLFASDGTIAGTAMVKDIYPNNDCVPTFLTELNGKVLFSARADSANNYELWVTDGTNTGTYLVKDINPGPKGSYPSHLIKIGSNIYFTANDGIYGTELWITDGTNAGTKMVKDITPGGASSTFSGFKSFGGKLYFSTGDFWVSDGTSAGTQKIQSNLTSDTNHAEYKGKMYFVGNDGTHGNELWCSDGTTAGTSMVKDIYPGTNFGARPCVPVVFKNELYFAADDSVHGSEIWKTDGTAAGTTILKDIIPGIGSGLVILQSTAVLYMTEIAVVNNKLIFASRNFTNNSYELWSSDGTTAGTNQIVTMNPTGYFSPRNFFVYKNRMLFLGIVGGYVDIYSTDGTATGTFKLSPPGLTTFPTLGNMNLFGGYVLHSDGAVYMNASFTANYDELWRIKDTSVTLSVNNTETNTNDVNIYPNPGDGAFTLQLANANYQHGSIAVYDVTGRIVYMQKEIPQTPTHKVKVDAPKGIYLLKLQLDDAVQTKQIVIE